MSIAIGPDPASSSLSATTRSSRLDDHQLAMAACDVLRHIGGDLQAPGLTSRRRHRK